MADRCKPGDICLVIRSTHPAPSGKECGCGVGRIIKIARPWATRDTDGVQVWEFEDPYACKSDGQKIRGARDDFLRPLDGDAPDADVKVSYPLVVYDPKRLFSPFEPLKEPF